MTTQLQSDLTAVLALLDAIICASESVSPTHAYREMIAVAKEEFGACKACEDEAPGMMCLEHLGRELDKQSHVHDLTAIRQFRLK